MTRDAHTNDDKEALLTAQASAWLARLHGPNRTPQAEEGFRAWLAESPEHVATFEHMTDTWEKSARLRRRPVEHLASWELPGVRVRMSRAALATAAVALLAVAGTLYYLRSDAIATSVGEQRILTLEDGSRVHLNTDTRAVVHYDSSKRRVELAQGEALFEVAKQSGRPFIVTAGDREIRALGTSFIVRREERDLTVTLVEGKVAVTPASAQKTVMLSPGERVTFSNAEAPRVDHPALDKLTAWQRGQVALDDVPLLEAVAEMNRYARKPLVVRSTRAESIRISGIFVAGQSQSFAQALRRSYGLKVEEESARIVVSDAEVAADGV